MRFTRPIVVAAAALVVLARPGAAPAQDARHKHHHPKGNPPSPHTVEANRHQRSVLPMADKKDFDEAKRGFIAAPDYRQIKGKGDKVVWDLGRFDFLLDGKDLDSVHPSLQRQAVLNMEYGLFEVVPGIYQIRGFDLANISFIKGKTGWIVIDPLTSAETAAAALAFINEKVEKRPVTAVIISHSHGDHFGGVRGVVSEEDLAAKRAQLIAPRGFMEEATSENLFAGNAMVRRKSYTYGDAIPAGPFANVDMAIGKAVSHGSVGILPPTLSIEKDIEEHTIDGVKMVFQNTPGTEAPAEMNTWFPDFKAFWAAENMVGGLHNILTLRGAPVRDAAAWARYINEALYIWGDQAEVMFASHSWPRWGKERILEVMRGQRDMYANLNNQVLHLANSGVTINEIHNVYEPPKSLQQQWFARGYHGTYAHNCRAVIQRYLGFWDCNPATLVPLSPDESAPLYVEMMGGATKIMDAAKRLYDEGKYRHAQEILNKLVYAEPQNQQAKDLLAATWEQLGYQAEGAGLRNIYLTGAKELRDGIVPAAGAKPGEDFIRGTPTALLLEFAGVRVDSRKAEGMKFKINLVTPDNGEKFVIEMSNATLTSIQGHQADDADVTVTLNRRDLEGVMIGKATLKDLAQAGKATLKGKAEVLQQLASAMTPFDPWFEILPGTKPAGDKPELAAGRADPKAERNSDAFTYEAPLLNEP